LGVTRLRFAWTLSTRDIAVKTLFILFGLAFAWPAQAQLGRSRALSPSKPTQTPTPPSAPTLNLMPLPKVISASRNIKLWDTSGQPTLQIDPNTGDINALALGTKDGQQMLISGGADGVVRLWNLASGAPGDTFAVNHGPITALALSPDNTILAVGAADGSISLWAWQQGRLLAAVPAHSDAVTGLLYAPDNHTLISAGADRQIRVWLLFDNGRRIVLRSSILAHDAPITGIALLAGATQVASVSEDGYLMTWNLATGAQIRRIFVCERGVTALAASPDGKTLATGDSNGHIRLWNAATGMPLAFQGNLPQPPRTLLWSADGTMLICGAADNTLSFWNVNTGKQVACIAAHDGPVRALILAP